MYDKPIIYKELAFVYIVNGRRFLKERDAEIYLAELEMREIGRRVSDAKQKG